MLPGGQGRDAQREAMRAWYESLDDGDVAWCIGEAAGAYGLLAAERLGAGRVVVFEADADRIPAVDAVFSASGYEEVTVEPATFLGWRTPAAPEVASLTFGSEDPVGAVVDAAGTPGLPTALLLDVPGYGAGVLSAFEDDQRRGLESVLLKTTDTLARSQLEDDGFETTTVARRPDRSAPWRRAVLARRDPAAEPSLPDSTGPAAGRSGGGEPSETGRPSSFLARERRREEWRVRDVAHLGVAAVLYLLSAVFEGRALLLGVLSRIPGVPYLTGQIFVGLVVAGLFVLFLVLATVFVELTAPLGVSERAAAEFVGGAVIGIPIVGALAFLWLAVGHRSRD